MNPRLIPFLFLPLVLTTSLSLEAADPRPISNITVIGSVFCDACSNNSFSNHSYFLQGVKVLVECKFRANSTSREDISVTADRTTDRFGFYMLDVPPVDGFECREGRAIESFCRASLAGSSTSSLCDVPGLRTSTEHVAVKCKEASVCLFNLNALNYRPSKKDAALCGTHRGDELSSSLNNSLFFWPPFPPFGFPWPFWPPWPSPFPTPPSLPFPFPPLPFITPPPALPFPFPPLPFFTPPPFLPFPPLPFFPPPPAFPFPFPPLPPQPLFPPFFPPQFPPPPTFPFPPFTPIPPLFAPPQPPPPTPLPPSLPFPFPPLPPLTPAPGLPSPPPTLSPRNPRSRFPFSPTSPLRQP